MSADTTSSSYWLNWRFSLCAIWIFMCMVFASALIWKYEGSKTSKVDRSEAQQERERFMYEDETWRPCLKEMHPAWLLGFRITAFFVLLALLIANIYFEGGTIFYFYTQLTFTLVTMYFALGSLFSLRGCRQYQYWINGYKVDTLQFDAERGTYVAPKNGESENLLAKYSEPLCYVRQTGGIWVYVFQVIFQINAGAVILTDSVFWLIIFPFLTIKDYKLSFFQVVMHSVNAVFLLGETALNCLRFPWFRIGYFMLWTSIFVIFQWVVHAFISMWWPYPFLDLESPYAPIWYMCVGLMHFPCYAIFALIVRLKQFLLSRWFPHSYQWS